jgi:YVTN family beta-propeller protein
MSRKKSRTDRRRSRADRLRPLASLLAIGLSAPALAGGSVPFPTYQTGPQKDGSWVVGDGQIITPAGIQVDLGIRVRAKAIALNPSPGSHTAAVLTLGARQAVEVFDTRTGQLLQTYSSNQNQDNSGSYSGITYSADGKYLMFSQDSSWVAVATVSAAGLLSDYGYVSVPPNNGFIKCFPNSPTGSYGVPCGTFYSPGTAYPGGVAFSEDGKSAYALLNQNNTLAKIDLTTMKQGTQIRVGNAPHSIVIKTTKKSDGTLSETAYISNEGGRAATPADFQVWSAGTPIVADPVNGSAITGTVSVVDLATMKVVNTISNGIGLHPTGMALVGDALLVLNTYSDSISVVDTATNNVMRTINLGLPIAVPGQGSPAYGAGPNAIAVDHSKGVAYVALYNANAIAVVDLSGGATQPVMGLIPVAYGPASVVLDKADNALLVANDKGVGTRFSFETDYGVTGYNTHQDNGTVSIVPLPNASTLASMTTQVYQNNHWDLTQNIASAGGGSPSTAPVPIPEKIGDPSLIKHVFLIIRENRTYDQVLGDVKAGNGDPSLTVFGKNVTPNAHALVKRFPLLDNFYAPSRQSADGHQWIVEAMAPYADDIESPDWNRSYPGGNGGDALAYQKKGFLFQEAAAAGLSVKIYGEYVETEYCLGQPPAPQIPANVCGNTPGNEPTWKQLYNDALTFEAGMEPTLAYQNVFTSVSSIPAVSDHLIKNFPQFDLGVPDQFRVDLWVQDFKKDVMAGTVPALSILWIIDDHTGGPPTAQAEQADNDLAIGRIIDYISHSNVWDSSAIFIEEDDAQNGVDHVDGHRSPAYVVSPYAAQKAPTDHTYYTQVNITRTIEQILGLPPMNQFDLVASPMRTAFVNGTPPKANFAPFTHLKNIIPLDQGVSVAAPVSKTLRKLAHAWNKMKVQMFAGKLTKPDSVDVDTLSHLDWYEATNFRRPYPGEKKVLWPTAFAARLGLAKVDDDD